MYWKTLQVEYVDQTDVLFLSYKTYLEAVLHDVDSKICYADNFSLYHCISYFHIFSDYVLSSLCKF